MRHSEPIEFDKPTETIEQLVGSDDIPSIEDSELLKIIQEDVGKYSKEFKKLEQIREKNESYFIGDQLNASKIPPGQSAIVDNRILMSIETMASIVTSNTPYPWVRVTPANKKGKKLQDKLERHLIDEWEYEQNMQQKMERMYRIFAQSRFAFQKVVWDDDIEDFVVDNVRPEKLRFDLKSRTVQDSPYVAEYVEMTLGEAMEKFPEKEEYLRGLIENGSLNTRSKITIIEYWGYYRDSETNKLESFVAWKYKDRVLGKEFNPYWNKKGDNHFRKPRHPYWVMNSINTAKSLVDDTSLIEQVIPIQDLINKRKRQIDANAGLANGVIVGSSAYIDKATFDKITMQPGERILLGGENEDVHRGLAVMTGRSLDSGVFQDLLHSIQESDNMFGTHDTTRGEKTSTETATGRAMLRDADFGRLDLTIRSYEQVAEECYNWMVQMMYVKYKNKKNIITPRENDNPKEGYAASMGMRPIDEVQDTISKDDLKGFKVKVIVKRGSTKPKDPAAIQDMAMTLMQVGQLDPLTFFEMISGDDMPEPRKAARRLFLWGSDPGSLFPEIQGADLVDYEAVGHIRNINELGPDYADEMFEHADLNDIEPYVKHVSTHRLYMQGVEVDDDLEDFSSLPVEVKEAHALHVELETERLRVLQEKVQERDEMRAEMMPVDPAMEQMPPEAMVGMPTEGPPIAPPTMGGGPIGAGVQMPS